MRSIIFLLALFLSMHSASAQATKSLFGGDFNTSFVWGFDFKVNSIQGGTGTLAGVYGGALFNKSTIVALTVASNVGHPTVNYSYIGLWSQYTPNPQELFHLSGQLLLALGATKDYENPKTSTMDNFANTSGPGFFVVEPGALAELNLSPSFRFGIGLSYRLVTGLEEGNVLIARTKVTNKDLSGINTLINLKIGLYE